MLSCQTQWRVGFAGATGLDYNALFLVAGALGMEIDAAMLDKIGLMEGEMLEKWRLEQDDEKKKRKR